VPDFTQKSDIVIDFSTIVHMLTGWQHQVVPMGFYSNIGDLWDFIKDGIFSSEEQTDRALMIGASVTTVEDTTLPESKVVGGISKALLRFFRKKSWRTLDWIRKLFIR
jgi:hypothetical protein